MPMTATQHSPDEASDYEMVRGTRRALSLFAGKWSVEVLYLLASGTRRYSEVLYEVGEISKKTLTQTLRALERHDLVAAAPMPKCRRAWSIR
jgi:DNA-binding HxlR family transcriptional regulator